MPVGKEVCVYLKWDNWPVTSEDFDLFLVDQTAEEIVALSEDAQTGAQEPTESLCYTNPGPRTSFGIAIIRYAAAGSPRFDLFVPGYELQFQVDAGATAEPASSVCKPWGQPARRLSFG